MEKLAENFWSIKVKENEKKITYEERNKEADGILFPVPMAKTETKLKQRQNAMGERKRDEHLKI